MLRSLVVVEPDFSLHTEFRADRVTGDELLLPGVNSNPRGVEDPIDERAQYTIISMFNLASSIDLNNGKCDTASMFPFKIVSGNSQLLHAELPSPDSDERACISVGSSNHPHENSTTNKLSKAISKYSN